MSEGEKILPVITIFSGFFILNLLIFKISYKVIEIRYYQLQSLPPMLTNFVIRLAGGGGGGEGTRSLYLYSIHICMV